MEQVMIYAMGSDLALRDACGELLLENLVLHVDLTDAVSMVINKRGKPKVQSTGRGMMIVTEKANLDAVFGRLRSHAGETLRAWAMPVVATAHSPQP